jgi:SAM-dependent methyltransferase
LKDARFADESYDAVFVWVCFDQLPNPREELAEIRRILRVGGRLFIQIPNGEFVKAAAHARRLVPLNAWGEMIYAALAFTGLAGFPYQLGFTPHCIKQVLLETGFDKIRIQNRLDLCSLADPATASVAKSRTLQRVDKVVRLVHAMTLGKARIGPWIEAVCQKM